LLEDFLMTVIVYSVALIESDKKQLETIEILDVLTVEGNAASPDKLIEAGINTADMLIAVTGSDEANILACVTAKSKGCRTIARISSTDYMKEGLQTGKIDIFGVDVAVSPDMVTATQISKMLLLPSLVESNEVAKGRSIIIELHINSGASAITRMPASIKLPKGATIGAVSRFGAVLKPELSGQLAEGDRLVMVLESSELIEPVEKAFGLDSGQAKMIGERLETGMQKIVIVGATRTGVQVAKLLEGSRVVLLVDRNEERCGEASAQLSSALVINGDATDPELLTEEGIEDASAFVAATENTEFNMLTCLLAKRMGVRKTLAIVDDPELRNLFEQIGINVAISPRLMTVSTIIKFITRKVPHSSLSMLQGSGVRVLEVEVIKSLWVVGREYGAIRFPKNAFIGSVIRENKVIVPTRFDNVRPGDRMIILTGEESVARVEKMFMHRSKSKFGFR